MKETYKKLGRYLYATQKELVKKCLRKALKGNINMPHNKIVKNKFPMNFLKDYSQSSPICLSVLLEVLASYFPVDIHIHFEKMFARKHIFILRLCSLITHTQILSLEGKKLKLKLRDRAYIGVSFKMCIPN